MATGLGNFAAQLTVTLKVMKLLNSRTHGFFDYGVVAVCALAPFVLGFRGGAAYLAWTVGAGHLALTLGTRFTLGPLKWITFNTHEWVELASAPLLAALPWVLNFSGNTKALLFFSVLSVVMFSGWIGTEHRAPRSSGKATPASRFRSAA